MLKNLFGKGKTDIEQSVAAPAPVSPAQPAPVRKPKPTQKKKNTYIVYLNTFSMPGMHELCATTPLAVAKINGTETENAHGGFMRCTEFPNPGACQMELLFHQAPEWRIIAGDKMAQTIIEYLDKTTGKPVLVLYPNGSIKSLVANEDVNTVVATRLNHASRRDLNYQWARIQEMVKTVGPMITARNKAMQNAPQYSSDAYAQFVAELDRMQIERAKQIVAQRQRQ